MRKYETAGRVLRQRQGVIATNTFATARRGLPSPTRPNMCIHKFDQRRSRCRLCADNHSLDDGHFSTLIPSPARRPLAAKQTTFVCPSAPRFQLLTEGTPPSSERCATKRGLGVFLHLTSNLYRIFEEISCEEALNPLRRTHFYL